MVKEFWERIAGFYEEMEYYEEAAKIYEKEKCYFESIYDEKNYKMKKGCKNWDKFWNVYFKKLNWSREKHLRNDWVRRDLFYFLSLISTVAGLFFDFWLVGWIWSTFGEDKSGGLGMNFLVLFLFNGWLRVLWSCIDFRLNDHVGFCL